MTSRDSRTPLINGSYFPYIDGLRALAVLSVFIYHLNPTWLPGGFTGVDVFFVISGFVVSASVSNFQEPLWKFLAYFYARRIKRIFPSLIMCLLLTAYVSALFIPQAYLSQINQKTGLYAFFGFSNFVLSESKLDYFAPATELNPYTHTWSLAVEEQFYLIFPLLFLPWLRGQGSRMFSIGLLALGFLASVAFSAWQSQAAPSEAYFLSPGRFWELAAGVLAFQFISFRPAARLQPAAASTRFRGALGVLSLAALSASFIFSPSAGFPVPGALLAVIGTLGAILTLHQHTELQRLHTFLSSRPLVAVGRISYSLYLWHWPVFTLFRWTYGLNSPEQRFISAALSFSLAVLSFKLIENPIRTARFVARAPNFALVGGGLIVIMTSWQIATYVNGRSGEIALSTVNKNPEMWFPNGLRSNSDAPGCIASPQSQAVGKGHLLTITPTNCTYEQPLSPTSIYVVGDSHAMAYEALFNQYAIQNSTRVNVYACGGCAFILYPYYGPEPPEHKDFISAVLSDLRTKIKSGDVLFLPTLRLPRLADQISYYGEESAFKYMYGPVADAERKRAEAYAVETLREFVDLGVRVVFEAPKPVLKLSPFRCADWFNQTNPDCAHRFSISRDLIERLRKPVLDSFANVAKQLPGVEVWDPLAVLCPRAECQAMENGLPLFFDGDHLSGYGNLKLVPSFTAFLQHRGNALVKNGAHPLEIHGEHALRWFRKESDIEIALTNGVACVTLGAFGGQEPFSLSVKTEGETNPSTLNITGGTIQEPQTVSFTVRSTHGMTKIQLVSSKAEFQFPNDSRAISWGGKMPITYVPGAPCSGDT